MQCFVLPGMLMISCFVCSIFVLSGLTPVFCVRFDSCGSFVLFFFVWFDHCISFVPCFLFVLMIELCLCPVVSSWFWPIVLRISLFCSFFCACCFVVSFFVFFRFCVSQGPRGRRKT